MNTFTQLSCVACMIFSSALSAAPAVAPANRVALWMGSSAFCDGGYYTLGYTSAMGNIQTLRSLYDSNLRISQTLDMIRDPGAYLDPKFWSGSMHLGITGNSASAPRQCVEFARSMTSAPRSTQWKRGAALINYLSVRPGGYVLNSVSTELKPGTMIAYFNGQSTYPTGTNLTKEQSGHVGIFLSWAYTNGYIVGVNMVDSNLTEAILVNGSVPAGNTASGLIQKHFIPINCPSGQTCSNSNWKYNYRYIASQYNVVDIP